MLPATAFLVLLLAAVKVPGGSTEVRVKVTPDFQQIKRPGQATVLCEFPTRPLVDCKVRVSDHGFGKRFDSLLEFGLGPKSARVELRRGDGHLLANASNHGTDLSRGRCGLLLEVGDTSHYPVLLVECSGQTEDGEWTRGLGLVTATHDPVLPVNVPTPRVMVVAPHSDVGVVFKRSDGGAMRWCGIKTPEAGYVYVSPTSSLDAASRYRHDSTGWARGECGFTLTNVTQRDAGVWRWYGDQGDPTALQATIVLVKAAPKGRPVLSVANATRLRVGDTLKATCRAPPGVPPAKLSWWLGDRQVQQKATNQTQPGEVGRYRVWQASPVVQSFSKTLTESDVGLRLKCRMTHDAVVGTKTEGTKLAVANCGRRGGVATAHSIGGKEAKESEFPWHVAIFRREADGSHTLVCGGSLVTPKFFVSAAHCFWDNRNRKRLSATLYKAAVGKHTLRFETTDKHEQRRSVKVIHMPNEFAGRSNRYDADIALVQLSAPVDLTEAVNVVCVHWKVPYDDGKLNTSSMGTVPGWGLTENNKQSSTLRFVALPFVPYEDCKATSPPDYHDFLLRDKMCGGFVNRSTSVCTGDSGGGFVFPEIYEDGRRRYFLRGVVSNGPGPDRNKLLKCQAEHRTVFTKVWVFAHWMEGLMAEEAASDSDY